MTANNNDKSQQILFLILGNQLFPPQRLSKNFKIKNVLMIENPPISSPYNFHKHRFVFHLSAMRQYKTELKKNKIKVHYISIADQKKNQKTSQQLKDFLNKNKHFNHLMSYEIENLEIEKEVFKVCKNAQVKVTTEPSPMFMTSREEFKDYLAEKKRPFMKIFYKQQRKRHGILVDNHNLPIGENWSFDSENRKKLPSDLHPPIAPKFKTNKTIIEVCQLVDKRFPSNPGSTNNFVFPTNRSQSLKWLDDFIKKRLPNFGQYQDSISNNSEFLYHSLLSPMLNIGLILPDEVINKAVSAYKSNPEKYPINSVEGFVRQILGWREFVRGIYQNYYSKMDSSNFWNHQNKLNNSWYTGNTGIEILDDTIKKTIKYAYNHHIERLMIISNFMLLCEIHPKQVFKWFMEMYIDSDEWVMAANVYGMGQFSEGGIFATKPYICGSNYYLKMSNYKKRPWCEIADGLYWRFIDKHKKFFSQNPRMKVMLNTLEKMPQSRKTKIFKLADKFIKSNTNYFDSK